MMMELLTALSKSASESETGKSAPDELLDKRGQEAVKALVRGLKKD
jgi:hypothetical protein